MGKFKSSLRYSAMVLFIMLLVIVLLGQSLQFASPSSVARPSQRSRRDVYVIMISIDGLIPEYYTAPASLGLKLPTLTKMKLNGAYAEGVMGVYPSVTYPSHTSLITGVSPARHGIYNNRIFEAPPAEQTQESYWFSKDLKTETLWSLAKRAGLVTANVGWPVTVGAKEIDYNIPEIIYPKENPPTYRRTKEYSTPGLIDKATAALPSDDTTADGPRTIWAEYIIQTYKPNLLLVHLINLDSAHHRYGPRSPEALKTVEQIDTYVARIIEATRKAGTFDKTTFFLVSDHGFASVTKRFEPNVLLAKANLITLDNSGKPTDWKAAAWPAGGACAIVLKDATDKVTAKKVNKLFGELLRRDGGPINQVLNQNEIKKLRTIPTAYLMLDAAPGFAFGEKMTGPEIHESGTYLGTHGQLPTRPEMRSSLIVYGAGARVDAKVGLARMIDIGPTAAAILGLRFENPEGVPISELIKPGLTPPVLPTKKKK